MPRRQSRWPGALATRIVAYSLLGMFYASLGPEHAEAAAGDRNGNAGPAKAANDHELALRGTLAWVLPARVGRYGGGRRRIRRVESLGRRVETTLSIFLCTNVAGHASLDARAASKTASAWLSKPSRLGNACKRKPQPAFLGSRCLRCAASRAVSRKSNPSSGSFSSKIPPLPPGAPAWR